MNLEAIRIHKFKRIDSIDLAVSDLTVLVGANGSGKSSILQALHLASCLMRQVGRIREDTTAMISVNDLDYLPTNEYPRLGHAADWGNREKSPSSKVEFRFTGSSSNSETALIEMRAARNAGISIKARIPDLLRQTFRGENVFFSGFIPGVSGIQNAEQKHSRRVVLKACSFGDSNAYLRNALNLLSESELSNIEEWLEPLVGRVRLKVKFDESLDFNIQAHAEILGRQTPLELLGTGHLQLIQIFCYILLFKPKILLVDEPDIHLHPTVQEKLPFILLDIARKKGTKIIMATHSPFIVRGSPLDTNVVWLSEGKIKSKDRSAVELALGWGAFGKRVIIASEDAKTDLLRKIIRQWPEIDQMVTVLPGRGYTHLLTREAALELKNSLGNMFKILVHRDRDSMTNEEVDLLKKQYENDGISLPD